MAKKHALQETLESIGAEIRSYSGRCMYGEECLAVTDFDIGPLFAEILRSVDRDDVEEVAEAVESFKTDSLGRGTVIYFPGTPFYDEDAENEDSDEVEDEEDAHP